VSYNVALQENLGIIFISVAAVKNAATRELFDEYDENALKSYCSYKAAWRLTPSFIHDPRQNLT
jgi:hypothetical protein